LFFANTDGNWQARSDHQLDQELNRQLLDVAVNDLADRWLRYFQHARRVRLAPTLSFDVVLECRSELAANVESGRLFGREAKVKKWVAAHVIKQRCFLNELSQIWARRALRELLTGTARPRSRQDRFQVFPQ
jgi:hypothetical protein